MGASLGVSRRFPDDFLGSFKFKFAMANFFLENRRQTVDSGRGV